MLNNKINIAITLYLHRITIKLLYQTSIKHFSLYRPRIKVQCVHYTRIVT